MDRHLVSSEKLALTEQRMKNLQAKAPSPEEEMSSKELTRLLESALDALPGR